MDLLKQSKMHHSYILKTRLTKKSDLPLPIHLNGRSSGGTWHHGGRHQNDAALCRKKVGLGATFSAFLEDYFATQMLYFSCLHQYVWCLFLDCV